MIFLHTILALFLGKFFGHYAAFIAGSLLPDIDHIYVYLKSGVLTHRNFSWKRLVYVWRNDEKHGIVSKTPLFHSVMGLAIFSLFVTLVNPDEGAFFAIAYGLHLLMDWMDKDVKYFLFPLRIKFKGFLPIWSKAEQIATVMALLVLVALYVV
ncbi:metal-dependent hydrolase [archaeon]|nr:metal-dependent hydrolase [archaeon]